MSWRAILGVVAALTLLWLALVITLIVARPDKARLREAMRLLPDVLRLLPRLARDKTLPRGVRVRLCLLLGYLATPVDLVPDFIPVLGYADDAIIVAAALRSVARKAGREAIERHWPGTSDGLLAVERLVGIDRVGRSPGQGRTTDEAPD